MDENKKKKTGEQESPVENDIQQEMEDLARIFKEELDKSKKEAKEDLLAVEEFEVEGYDPKKVSKSEKKAVEKQEMCEYCGTKPRGTEKNPKSPYCKDCEELLEKCPYDYKGVIAAMIIICIVIGAVFCFAVNTPIFSLMKKGDKAVEDNRLYSAVIDYEKALEYVQAKDTEDVFYNLHAKRVNLFYRMANISSISAEVEEYLGDDILKLPTFKKTKEINDHVDSMIATSVIITRHVNLDTVTAGNYEETLSALDNLVGKKVYVRGTEYFEEGEEGFTPNGKETVYTLDAGWIYIVKYQASVRLEKEAPEYVEDMKKAVDASDFMLNTAGYMLAGTYVELGRYDKAEEIANKLYANNTESTDYYLIMSMVKRYRDKDYNGAIAVADQGITALTNSSGGSDMVIQYGHPLRMQKGLNYIMLGDYNTANDVLYDCCYYLSQTPVDSYGTTMISLYPMAWEISALTALEVGDTEMYEAMEENLKTETDAEIDVYEANLEEYKAGTKTLVNLVESGRYDLI